ncbi:MAG: hypothetical protein ABR987_11580 [Terracidiphilus sp.]
MTPTVRYSMFVIIALLLGAAGKVTVDRSAAGNLAAARRRAQDRVSADNQAINRLAEEVVPRKSELVCGDSFPNAPGTYAGMCGVRSVPDEGAASKLEADRKAAEDKLMADQAQFDNLMKHTVRWQDAFVLP